jgi:hypothetical protein
MSNPEHRDTLKCHKRDGGPLYALDGIEPVGFTGKPCKCKFWSRIPQREDTATGTNTRILEGCRFDMDLFITSTLIRKCNHAALMAIEANKETQSLRRDIGTLVQLAIPPEFRAMVDVTIRAEALRGTTNPILVPAPAHASTPILATGDKP